jgi:hypothetical protein
LGLFTVATAGTVIPLTTNVKTTNAFGTPAAGVSGLTTVGQLAPITANQIICMAPSANTGDVYLVFKGQAAAGTGGTSVVLSIPKGTTQILRAPQMSNPFQVDVLGVDAATNGDKLYVTLVIGV